MQNCCIQLPIEDSLMLAASGSATASVTGTTMHEFKSFSGGHNVGTTMTLLPPSPAKDFSPFGGYFSDHDVLWKVTDPQILRLQQLSAGNIRSFAISFPAPILPRPQVPGGTGNSGGSSDNNARSIMQMLVSLANGLIYRFQVNWTLKMVGESSIYFVDSEMNGGISKPTMQISFGNDQLLQTLSDGSFISMRLPQASESLPEFIHGQSPVYKVTQIHRFRPENSLLSKIRGLVPLWSSSSSSSSQSSTLQTGGKGGTVDVPALSGNEVIACTLLSISGGDSESFAVSLSRDRTMRVWRLISGAKASAVATEILPTVSSLGPPASGDNMQHRDNLCAIPPGRNLICVFNKQTVDSGDDLAVNLMVHMPTFKDFPLFFLYRIEISINGSMNLRFLQAIPCHVLSKGLSNDSCVSLQVRRVTENGVWEALTLWRSQDESISAVLTSHFQLLQTPRSAIRECQWSAVSQRGGFEDRFDDFLFDERAEYSSERFLAQQLSIGTLKQAYDVYMGKPSSRLYNYRTALEWKQHLFRELTAKASAKLDSVYQDFSSAGMADNEELRERLESNIALEWNRFLTIYLKLHRNSLVGFDLALLSPSAAVGETADRFLLINVAGLGLIEESSAMDQIYSFTTGKCDWFQHEDGKIQPALQCLRYFASLLDRRSLTNELRPYLRQTLNVSIETFASDFCERTLPSVPPFAYRQVQQLPLKLFVELSELIAKRFSTFVAVEDYSDTPFLRNDYLVQLARISTAYHSQLMMNSFLLALVCAKINKSSPSTPVSVLCRTVPALISNIRGCISCMVFCQSADPKTIQNMMNSLIGLSGGSPSEVFSHSFISGQTHKHLLVASVDALLKSNHLNAAEDILNSNHADGWVLYLLAMLHYHRGNYDQALSYFLKFAPAITQFAKNENDAQIAKILVAGHNILNLYEYYLHAMELFKAKEAFKESNSCALLAVKFKQPDDSSVEENDYLHSNIFQFHLNLGEFESAFNILDKIKNAEILETDLNNLVTRMCEGGQQEALCLLPAGRWTDTIVEILEFKARNSGALVLPNYFKILYGFYTIRADHQKAAHWMYRFAITVKHTREIGPEDSLMIRAKSLLTAINSLALASRETAFIANDEFILACQDEALMDRLDSRSTVLDVKALRQIYILLIAQLQLAAFTPELLTQKTLLNPIEAVSLCMTSGLFELAVNIALTHEIPMVALEDRLPAELILKKPPRKAEQIIVGQ